MANPSARVNQLDMALNTKEDLELSPPAGDGISCLAFSPVADYVASSSWDNQVSETIIINFLYN
jgi:WD40 repeat protein